MDRDSDMNNYDATHLYSSIMGEYDVSESYVALLINFFFTSTWRNRSLTEKPSPMTSTRSITNTPRLAI